ncbi:MAG: cytidine deaminase [Actinomycetota bacterium]
MTDQLGPEDAKLLTLARGAAARLQASEGAAVRDETGRTYSSAGVTLGEHTWAALDLAVAQAAAAGARGLEAAVVVTDTGVIDIDVVRALAGVGVPVYLCSTSGSTTAVLRS